MTSETATPSSPISSSEARRAARNAGAIAAATLLSRGMQFAWQLFFSAALGPAILGIYGTVSGFTQIGTSISAFGMSPIVIRDVAQHPERAGKYLTTTLFIQTLLALLAYVVLNLAAAAGGYSEAVRVFLALSAVNLIIDTLGNMCFDLLLAREKMVTTSIVSIAHVVVLIALAGLGLLGGYSLFGIYAGVTVAGILRSAALWVLAWRSGIRPAWPLDRSLAKPLLVNSAPLAVTAFITLAYQQVDKLVTNRIIGDTETGYLVAAFVIFFGVVELLNTTILTAFYPLMARSYGDGKNEQFGFMVEKLAFFTLLICLPITLVVSVFSHWLTMPIWRENLRPAAGVLSILIWYALIMMVGNNLSQAMLVQNKQRRLLIIKICGLGVNLLLLALLLPAMGVHGAPLSSVVAEGSVFVLLLVNFRAVGWSIGSLAPRVLRLLLVGVVAGAVMLLLRESSWPLALAAGLVIYTAGVLGLRVLADADWDLLYRLVAALPGGAWIRRCWKRDVTVNW
ncbi:MAG: oligosaccharide flippase family protein [Chloroflexi bacterium]|nr:oligosaccharide flippase family protein [Chloroflexota bacterium]MCC6895467.1 oligosaccharide flippase family protein [Anaerolineae bacterium]